MAAERGAWERWVVGEALLPSEVPAHIAESWERCRRSGLDPLARPRAVVLAGGELARRREDNALLLEVSRSCMSMVYSSLPSSRFVISLADAEGYRLEALSTGDLETSLLPGFEGRGAGENWSEAVHGTNGLGTALALGAPVFIRGEEHFFASMRQWNCSGAPVRDVSGRIVGVLSLSGPAEDCSVMVHGLTVTLARSIEHELELRAVNSRLADQNRHLETLYALSEQVAAGAEAGDKTEEEEAQAIPRVVQRLGRLFPHRHVVVFEHSPRAGQLLLRAAYPGFPPDLPASLPTDADHPACWCVRDARMVLLTGNEVPPARSPLPHPHAVLALPILTRGSVGGILMVTEPGPEVLSPQEVRTYEAAARQLSLHFERRRLRHYLHVESKVREAILEQMDVGILLFDLVRNRLTWNRTLRPFFKSAGQVQTKLGELPLPENALRYPVRFQRGPTAGLLAEVQRTGAVLHDEAVIFCDQPRTFRVTTGPVFGPGGRVELIVQSYTDVTPYRALEQMKTELVAMISHELRTPITAVKGYAQLIAGLRPGDETHQTLVAGLLRETGELAAMVERVLAVNRLELEQRFSPGAVPIKGVLEEVISRLRTEGGARQVRVVLEGRDGLVRGDRDALHSIFSNLVHNAIKYSPQGSQVRVRLGRGKNMIAVTVADCGPGIPAEYHETIFQRFFRVPSPESVNIPGSGLGLYIVRRLVEQHGGQVRVRSRPGKGTTFTVTLPEEVARVE